MSSIFSLNNIISEFKRSFNLSMPLVITEVIYGLSSFIATVMVAHLSKEELAANALVWGIYLAIILFFIGIIVAVSIITAQSYGANDSKGIGICFKQGLIISIVFALPMMLFMRLAPMVLSWTGQDMIIIKLAQPFFYALSWSILTINFLVLTTSFLSGINRTKASMFLSMMIIPIEIFFYYAFLFGKFGMPKMGLAGIGYALTISNTIVSIVSFSYLYFSTKFKVYHLFTKWWKINKKFLLELLRIGLPMGAMICIEVSLVAVNAIMMGKLGTTVLAAYQISHQYIMIALVVIFGLTQGVVVRIGNEVGQNNRDVLKLVTLVNIGMAFGIMSLFSIFYVIFPELAISIDLNIKDHNLVSLINIAKSFLSIVAVLVLVEGTRLVIMGALRGLKDTKFSMLVSILGFWVIAFPGSYLLAFKLKLGGIGILWGFVIGLAVTALILWLRFNFLVKHIDLKALVTRE